MNLLEEEEIASGLETVFYAVDEIRMKQMRYRMTSKKVTIVNEDPEEKVTIVIKDPAEEDFVETEHNIEKTAGKVEKGYISLSKNRNQMKTCSITKLLNRIIES